MSENRTIQTSLNAKILEQAAATLSEMGLTIPDAICLLMTMIAREKSLPTELFGPNETTKSAMKEAQTDGLPRVTSMNKFFEAMNADE